MYSDFIKGNFGLYMAWFLSYANFPHGSRIIVGIAKLDDLWRIIPGLRVECYLRKTARYSLLEDISKNRTFLKTHLFYIRILLDNSAYIPEC